MRTGLEPSEQDIMDYCLLELEKEIRRIDSTRSLADFDLPERTAGAQNRLRPGNVLVNEERDYDVEQMRETVDCELSESQSLVTERILESVRGEPKVLFLQDPGGTRQRFVENYLLAKVRLEGKVALAGASRGIAAALLLQGGRTAHSRFKIPLKVGGDSSLPITKAESLGRAFVQDFADNLGRRAHTASLLRGGSFSMLAVPEG